VNTPGSFALEKDMFVEDAILLAGGFSDPADQTVVYVNREERNPNTEVTSLSYVVTIDATYINGEKSTPSEAFVLEAKDIITIRKDRAFEPQQRIVVEGEVLYPRPVVATSKRVSLGYLLSEVGGLTDLAYLKSSYVLRDNNVLAVSLDRVNKNTPMFVDGDKLVISKNYGNVTTVGALENPSIFNWTKGKRAKYYLKNSGGKLDKLGGKAFVVLNNGKTRSVGFFNNPKVFPDSKIVVNYKAAKEKQEGKFLNDATNILGTLTGALTTILLIDRL
jgi:protein involved in polysaccharide export with SLBB domain